ncbi:hypothetical protein E2C06_30600 [Dankookia rubra]|uniref:Uncharacterized protein n=1 Tax=Dankookia rubra TaxID=1442381 RepID=A0A4R5Q7F1_9PROT|nr:hypothetical protein [Dankookia rubra]TDH58820.1 hypothetical protein E2C06_30600 [Dankookia rubra]
MTSIPDDVLLRDPRPAAELRRALLAPTICRIAFLRKLGRFTRMADALQAIEADQARRAHTADAAVLEQAI